MHYKVFTSFQCESYWMWSEHLLTISRWKLWKFNGISVDRTKKARAHRTHIHTERSLFPINMERIWLRNDWNWHRVWLTLKWHYAIIIFLWICIWKSAHGMSLGLQPIIIHSKVWEITEFGCKLTKAAIFATKRKNLNEHNFLQQLLDWNRMTPSRPIVCRVHTCAMYFCAFFFSFCF